MKLVSLAWHLTIYANGHHGRFPESLAELDFSGLDRWSRMHLLSYADPVSEQEGEWAYFPGHTVHSPDGTVLIAAPYTFRLGAPTNGPFRLVLQLEEGAVRLRTIDESIRQVGEEGKSQQRSPEVEGSRGAGPVFQLHGQFRSSRDRTMEWLVENDSLAGGLIQRYGRDRMALVYGELVHVWDGDPTTMRHLGNGVLEPTPVQWKEVNDRTLFAPRPGGCYILRILSKNEYYLESFASDAVQREYFVRVDNEE